MAQQRNIKKVVLAYSGGLDTSVILKWLQVNYGCEVITMTADVGQEDDLNGVDEKALRTGATKAYIEDLREEFAKDFIFPMLRSGALYEGRYLLGTSVARPLITKRLVEIARAEGADALAHGATGKGNDQVRFELSAAALAPDLRVIAPWREWDLMSRTALNFFAEQHNIPISSGAKHYSMDRNMLHCSFEGGELEDPWEEPLEASHIMAVPFEKAPDEAEYVTITFEHGDPVAVNGEALSPAQIMVKLNELGRKHGIGRVDMVENRFVGIKSRGVYETPGGTIIYVAHKDLEGITMERETMHIRDMMMPSYAGAIYNGFWYSPEREAMQAFIDKSQERVSGTVRLKLYKGNAWPVGRESKNTLYCADLATFEECATYDHKDAAGFIKLNSLRIRGYRKDLIKYDELTVKLGRGGETFLKKGSPRPSQTLPTPSQDFHPYRIPLHSFSNVCNAVPFWCIFRESKNSRIVALSGSPYMNQPGNFRSGKPVSSPSSANLPAYKSLWKGRDGVWGREGKAFLQKSFPSLPQYF